MNLLTSSCVLSLGIGFENLFFYLSVTLTGNEFVNNNMFVLL